MLEGDRRESSILMAIAGETAPYCFLRLYGKELLNYATEGFISPLDEFIKKDPPRKLQEIPETLQTTTLNDKTYGLLYYYQLTGLYYRKDLFREAGLDPEKPPQNWDELFEMAKQLTNPSKGRFGFALTTSSRASTLWVNFLYQAGGQLIEQTPDGKYKAVFDSPAGVEALEFYKKLRWTKWKWKDREVTGVVIDSRESIFDFAKGKTAMFFGPVLSPIMLEQLENEGLSREQYGIAPLPAGPGGREANFYNGYHVAINAQIKDLRNREASWEYAKFQASEEAHKVRVDTLVSLGYELAASPRDLRKFGYESLLQDLPKNWESDFEKILKNAIPPPIAPKADKVQTGILPIYLAKVLESPNANCQAILTEAANLSNAKFFHFETPEEKAHKQLIVAPVVIIFFSILVFFVWKMIRIMSTGPAHVLQDKNKKRSKLRIYVLAFCFMGPAVAACLVWQYYPLLRGLKMAFYDYKILGESQFIGLDNFITAFTQPEFYRSLYRTFTFVLMTMGLGFVAPIFLAILLNEVPRFKITYRILWYLPALTSGAVVMFLWKELIYDPTPNGLLNQLISYVGIPPQKWLADSKLAMFCIVLTGVWAHVGPGSVLYLAALKTIPESVYEAADLDGAGVFHKIRHITLPMLKVLISINFLGAFIGAFHGMHHVLIMTGGGPGDSTMLMGVSIFFEAFLYLKFGYATAVAWILGAMLIGFTIYQLKLTKDARFDAVKENV
jgi:ABC-type sugar transport system permease subunit/ABC-type glycerol-3-phosphate transport system substrate-binding protein